MAGPASEILTPALTAWAGIVQKRSAWVIVAFAALTSLSGFYAATHLEIDTDTSAMLSPELPWRQAEIAYSKAFPIADHGIVAVLDGANPEQVEAAQSALLAELAVRPVLKRVEAPGSGPFFERNGFLFLDAPQLEDLATRLEAAQPFFGRLTADPSLAGLLDLLSAALRTKGPDLPFDLSGVLDPIAGSVSAGASGRPAPLSWQSLVAC